MAAASATGEKLLMFVIWKSKNPHCFKNVKHQSCEYKSQKKSWMNSEIFEEWDRKLNWKFCADDRKIALIIDHCSAHPSISNLTNVQIVFLPPNTMSILQPIDQGVIHSLKAHYRGRIVRFLCRTLEKKRALSKDFNFAINEDTGWFLRGRNQRNQHQLFQEGRNHPCCLTVYNCWFRWLV